MELTRLRELTHTTTSGRMNALEGRNERYSYEGIDTRKQHKTH